MMFFKAVFALYLAAIALAAPGRLVDVGDVGKLRLNPGSSMLCTSLSNVDVGDNEIVQDVANNAHVIV
jgi:hypothetical protein